MGRDRLINLGGGGAGVSGLDSADAGNAIADNELIRGDGTTGIQGSTAALTDAGVLTVPIEDAGTTTVLYPLILKRTTSGTAAAGLGVGETYTLENGSGTEIDAFQVEARLVTATAGSEDFDFAIKGRRDGVALGDWMVLKGRNGNFSAGDVVFNDPSTVGTAFCLGVGSSGTVQLRNAAASANVDLGVLDINHGSAGQTKWASSTAAATVGDTGLERLAAGVIGTTDGATGEGWIQNSSGDRRLTANVTESAAAMTNLTDLTVTVAAGRKYTGKMVIYCVDSTAAEGIKFDFDGGTATMTSFRAHGTLFDTGLLLSTQTTALATDFAAATVTGDSMFEVHFSFVVNGAGTFIPRFAQNSHAVGTATAYLGSYIQVSDSFN